MSPRKDISGQRFGNLLALNFMGIDSTNHAIWLCRCDCGNMLSVLYQNLKNKRTKSCGCMKKSENFDGTMFPQCLRMLKLNAKNRKLTFTLTDNEAKELMSKPCYYCGKNPSNLMKSTAKTLSDYKYSGIDRVDNSQGYILENCVPCCKRCNFMKRNLSKSTFIKHIKRIIYYQNHKFIENMDELFNDQA